MRIFKTVTNILVICFLCFSTFSKTVLIKFCRIADNITSDSILITHSTFDNIYQQLPKRIITALSTNVIALVEFFYTPGTVFKSSVSMFPNTNLLILAHFKALDFMTYLQ